MNKILMSALILSIIYGALFFVPERVETLALAPGKAHEVWRFITYQFVHLNHIHLLQNIAGLALVAFIAKELKTNLSSLSSTYLSAGMLSALPLWAVLSFVALGASNAVMGGFGLLSQQVKEYGINPFLVSVLLAAGIFIEPLFSIGSAGFKTSITQAFAHLSGLLFGIVFFLLLKKVSSEADKRKRKALRGVAS